MKPPAFKMLLKLTIDCFLKNSETTFTLKLAYWGSRKLQIIQLPPEDVKLLLKINNQYNSKLDTFFPELISCFLLFFLISSECCTCAVQIRQLIQLRPHRRHWQWFKSIFRSPFQTQHRLTKTDGKICCSSDWGGGGDKNLFLLQVQMTQE